MRSVVTLVSVVVVVLLLTDVGSGGIRADSPPAADQFAIDMDPDATPANTTTSVGTIEPCADVILNGIVDGDEDAVDAINFDVVTAPNGIPASNAMTAYGYTLTYPSPEMTITSHTPRLLYSTPPIGIPSSSSDPTPDSDGEFVVAEADIGGEAESGPGVLDSFSASFSSGNAVLPLSISNPFHIDTSGVSHAPDTVTNAFVAIDDPGVNGTGDILCFTARDLKTVSVTVNAPPTIPAGFDRTITIDAEVHNNGPDSSPPADVDATLTLPPSCTADGQQSPATVSTSISGPSVSVTTPVQLTADINCTQGGSQDITVEVCISLPLGGDLDQANNCQTDILNVTVDDSDTDGDGFSDENESGTPLCGDGVNDDGADDGVIDDGCPGGPPQAGAFSEAQFNIGTDELDACEAGGSLAVWPAELHIGGIPDSTNNVNILDITSFLAPVRRLNNSPGDLDFNQRWDLTPGPGLFTDWINISDLTRLLTVKPPAPPYDGDIAFNGVACQ